MQDYRSRRERLIAGFGDPIAPVRTTPFYRVAILIVALLMVALPLVYLGIVAGTAYGVYWYAINGTAIFEGGGSGRGQAFAVVVGYGGPLVAGATLVVFMIKPLFAPRGKHPEPVSVGPEQEPLLHEFVDALCDRVGAPRPKRIDLVCEVNASASFRRGWLSMTGNDLVLTIGLPLVSCMDLRQLTGVLAHEFGHFTQGLGMRATYVVGSVNHWFARVVYQRDAWDEKLDAWAAQSGNIHWGLMIVLYLTKLAVWLTRRVLWLLMLLGHLFSSVLSRQMEFDADRHAYRTVGRGPFGTALRELPVIAAAEHGAQQDLGQAFSEQRLVDDLPALIQANAGQIPGELRERLIAHGMTTNTGMYDSHPATRDRLAAAEETDGIFTGDGPATALFRDYAALSKAVTLAFYRDMLQLDMRRLQLVATSDIVADSAAQQEGGEAQTHYLRGAWSYRPLLPMKPLAVSGTVTAATIQSELAKCHAQIDAKREHIDRLVADFDRADDERDVVLRRAALAGLAGNRRDGRAVIVEETWQQAYDDLVRFAGLFVKRLGLARLLLDHEPALRGDWRLDQLDACTQALRAFHKAEAALFTLRERWLAFAAIVELLQERHDDERVFQAMQRAATRTHAAIGEYRAALREVPYPFDHRDQNMDLARYVCSERISRTDPQAIYEGSGEILKRSFTTIGRCLQQLARFGAGIDAAIGLPAMPPRRVEDSEANPEPTAV